MPRRDDLKTILILGSGPIVIGQGCEFDYSGTQACKALKAEGYRIVLVNSNPATIMTDPAFSDRTYIEPITPEAVRKIIEKECDQGEGIDAILPTLGGQTALNCACALYDDGTLEKHRIEMIGATREVIHRAEDREQFQRVCDRAGLKTPHARRVESLKQAMTFLDEIGLPAIIRPAFTLGGTGGGIAYNTEEYRELVSRGLAASMITQVQIDQSLIGWKEFELEVVRDRNDNCIVICGIENIDPMGVHTGDSITVAPILTLTDKEYQALRDAAFAVMRGVGVETGGSNVQFAVNPNPSPDANGDRAFEFVVVEMNPRVSRSSALASKATGFPIAKVAARLAVGYSLDELRNDITGTTSACFEPTIDYVVTKMPRWTFEKFPEADETLTTQMKSVGEAMAIGRTFKESLQKVIRSMEVKRFGLGLDRNDKWLAHRSAVQAEDRHDATPEGERGKTAQRAVLPDDWPINEDTLTRKIAVPCQGRLHFIRYAFKLGWSIERIHELSRIDPFFLDQIAQLVEFEDTLCSYTSLEDVPRDTLFEAKQLGYSDAQLANLYLGAINSDTILKVRGHRKSLGIEPVYKLVDTCAAEFEAATPYFYSTYEKPCEQISPTVAPSLGRSVASSADEARVSDTPKVIIIGGGPNRIGQGIEFDYCCVHAAMAAKQLGFEAVMINSNPETVSTDYDTSDLLFFEPLTLEDTLNVIERLNGGPLRVGEQTRGITDEVNPTTPETSEANPSRPSVASSLDRSVASPPLVHGVIVQFGGQTPLNLASGLVKAGVHIIGTSLDSIDLAEDRDRFDALLERLDLKRPASGIARSLQQAVTIATVIGYPVLVRPSYVLGGRGMEICHDEDALRSFMTTALDISDINDAPILIDKFIDGATEVDVDVVADFPPSPVADGGTEQSEAGGVSPYEPSAQEEDPSPYEPSAQAEGSNPSSLRRSVAPSLPQSLICGVMEHIEQAGIHSGDSSCTIPQWSLSAEITDRIKDTARRLAAALKVNGLMNVQMAVKDDEIYIIEVNPRASRTVPFVGKAKHVSWASIAAKVMMGKTLEQLGAREIPDTGTFAIKESVFPFNKFPGVDVVLGPEMRSTGEVMGIDPSLPIAFAKGQMSAGVALPREGGVFISVRDADKPLIADIARPLFDMGFNVYTTAGTAEVLQAAGLAPRVLEKIAAGARPNVIDLMSDGEIALVINTPTRTGWQTDEGKIRATAVRLNIPMITTATGALASVKAIEALRQGDWTVRAMQDYAAAANVEPIKA